MTGFAWWTHDSWEMVRRNLIHIKRTPELLLDVTLSPIMFVLLFSIVFGGAITVGAEGGDSQSYTNFLMAGIFVQTVAFAGIYTSVLLANDLLPEPLPVERLATLAATIGADVPFFLGEGPQLGTGDGTVLSPVNLPIGYAVLLLVPAGAVKSSTGDVYRAFDARNGAAGFDERRRALLEAVAIVRDEGDLALLPPNDLASSPLSEELLAAGAFRADVSGAGPCVYALFAERKQAEAAARSLRSKGTTWVVFPAPRADATEVAVSTLET